MSKKNWSTDYTKEPWEQDTYQTGRTSPPRSYGGLIAVLLVVGIVLFGVISALSMLKIHLFQAMEEEKAETPLSFTETHQATVEQTAPAEVTQPQMELEIQDSSLSPENIPQEGGMSLQEIYTNTIPAVVSISCTMDGGTSSGTGVVVHEDGYIVTNCHVVEGSRSVQVLFTDDRTAEAVIVGTDSTSDLAVLRVELEGLKPAQFGDSDALRVGDAVAAIGDPLGIELRGTMTNGIVSAINRNITSGGRTMTLIQTNAALNAGNSGGPLLNCYGQVVGINTMKIGDYMSSAGVEGLGFAIPSTTVKEVVEQLISQGYVSGRPRLGIEGEDVSILHQIYSNLPQGVYITSVDSDSDAARKGVRAGDILIRFDDTRVTSVEVLETLLYSHQAGDSVSVVIYRGGAYYTLDVTIAEAR